MSLYFSRLVGLAFLKNMNKFSINQFIHLKVPYFSQWESKKLVKDIVEGSINSQDDPLWMSSGASSPEEYELWSRNLCGMACLKSILKYTQNLDIPIATLGKKCREYGGYISNGEEIGGLFYAPFVEFVKKEYDLDGSIRKHLSINDIIEELSSGNFVIASVSHQIRNLESIPTKKGGHLVLMLGYNLSEEKLFFHNPSGYIAQSQEEVEISFDNFNKFFANRGIVVCSSAGDLL